MPLPPDLRLLWYFKQTAEIGSLTKAAAELGTFQPALTVYPYCGTARRDPDGARCACSYKAENRT
jgi:hypothetical protein